MNFSSGQLADMEGVDTIVEQNRVALEDWIDIEVEPSQLGYLTTSRRVEEVVESPLRHPIRFDVV